MNKLIVAAIRCLLILLVPAIVYAISAQLGTHDDKAKSGIGAHSGTHNKRTPGSSPHGSRAGQGKHPTGGSTHTQSAQHHMAMLGRHSRGAKRAARKGSTVTPTPTETPAATPEPSITATPTPSPMGNSTATP